MTVQMYIPLLNLTISYKESCQFGSRSWHIVFARYATSAPNSARLSPIYCIVYAKLIINPPCFNRSSV